MTVGSSSDSPRPAAVEDLDEPVRPRLLEHVAVGTGDDGGEDGLVVGRAREEDDGHRRELGPDVAAGLDPRTIREAHVHEDEVGHEPASLADRLGPRARLRDDLELAVALQEGHEAGPDDLVIVHDQQPERRDRGTSCRFVALDERPRNVVPRGGAVVRHAPRARRASNATRPVTRMTPAAVAGPTIGMRRPTGPGAPTPPRRFRTV